MADPDIGDIKRRMDGAIDALHRDNLPHIFQKPEGPVREKDYFSELLADKNVGFFVAELDKKLVGFVHMIIKDTPALPIFVPRRFAILDALLVKSEFQQQGIGRMLMDTGQEWAVTRGATSIELNAYEFNQTAISFYESSGYQTYSRKMRKELGAEKRDG